MGAILSTQSVDSPAALLASLTQPEEGSLRMSVLQRAVSHEGDLGHLDCILEHVRAGGQTSITLIGTPRGRTRSDALHARVQRWLHRRFELVAKAAVNIQSIPVSGRDGMCAGWRLPPSLPRLVFIDTSAMNAGRPRASRNASAADGALAAAAQLEGLIRSQLSRPLHAVVLVHGGQRWHVRAAAAAAPWAADGSEGQVHTLARYYALPSLSLRDALWSPLGPGHEYRNASTPRLGLGLGLGLGSLTRALTLTLTRGGRGWSRVWSRAGSGSVGASTERSGHAVLGQAAASP